MRDLKYALIEADEACPTFLVLRYDVAEESMEAEMSYDELQPGVPEDDLATHAMLLDRWATRLQETGDESPLPSSGTFGR